MNSPQTQEKEIEYLKQGLRDAFAELKTKQEIIRLLQQCVNIKNAKVEALQKIVRALQEENIVYKRIVGN